MTVNLDYPEIVDVTIEISRWSFLKYQGVGKEARLEFVSPLPSPFNYGYVAEVQGGDGAELDAVVLGKRIQRGLTTEVPVRAVVRFLDAGCVDDKLICSERELGRVHTTFLRLAFFVYARLRALVNFFRGKKGRTTYLRLEVMKRR